MEGTNEKSLNIKGADDLIRQLGYPGRFQIFIFILVALNYFPVVFHHVCMAFYGYTPPFECRPQRGFAADVETAQQSASLMMSYDVKGVNMTVWKKRHVIHRSCDVVVTSENGVNRSERCEAGSFRYFLPEEEKTAVMEWDLVCDQAYLTHLATTIYYCGVTLGGISCGYLSDYFGRRPVMLVGLAGATILGTALGFIRDFPVFLALRFVVGFLMQGLHMASYIMAIELFPVEERTLMGCIIQLFWGGAVLCLGLLSWLIKDWRHIQLAISIPTVITVSYLWLIPESLRWLLAKSKAGKAQELIKRIAVFNKIDSPLRTRPEIATWALLEQQQQQQQQQEQQQELLSNSTRSDIVATSAPLSKEKMEKMEKRRRKEEEEAKAEREEEEEERRKKKKGMYRASVKDLFSTPVMLKRSLILFCIWFGANLSYFGLTFMSTSLAGNRFLNYSLSGIVEFFAYAINIFVVRRFGRRNPLCFYLCMASVSCLGVGFVPPVTSSGVDLRTVVTAFSVMGKFAAGGSFTCIDLLTVEMYPTVLRNVGAGLCGFWGRLGAVVAPQCLSLALYTFSQLPAILIGSLTLVGGLLALLLPDTSHVRLPDTVYEITVKESESEDGELAGNKLREANGTIVLVATVNSDGVSESLLRSGENVSSV